ncbi:MAG: ABC transporter ATP-binding protein [Micrococcus sp.]|nr:ABC transporter ATP-binding protein [Micrococcus sp.]
MTHGNEGSTSSARPGGGGSAGGILRRPELAIDAQGLRRSFGKVAAVRDISVQVKPGEVTALVGPNGSGKTTLMLILATLLRPDEGSVCIGGVDALSDPLAARQQLGWMPDTLGVWDSLSCLDILTTMGRLYGMSPAEAKARAEEQLEWVHLTDFAHRPARVLSRGQQQRISLARATIHRPSVLLLDEPANGLDPDSRIRLREDLRAMAARGTAVLVSSHVLAELEEMSDAAIVVREGVTVGVSDLSGAGEGALRYRVSGPVPGQAAGLLAALERRGVGATAVGGRSSDAFHITVPDAQAAARLLAELVGEGVEISHFAADRSRLEDAYLAQPQPRPVPATTTTEA